MQDILNILRVRPAQRPQYNTFPHNSPYTPSEQSPMMQTAPFYRVAPDVNGIYGNRDLVMPLLMNPTGMNRDMNPDEVRERLRLLLQKEPSY